MSRVLLMPSARADLETARLCAALAGRLHCFQTHLVNASPALLFRGALAARPDVKAAAVVHCFGVPALLAAMLAGARQMVMQPIGVPGRRVVDFLSSVTRRRALHVVVSSDAARRRCVIGGVPDAQCSLIRPGVDLGAMRLPRDSELRSQFGFTEGDRVLFAPLGAVDGAGASVSFWAASLLNVLDPRYKLLIQRTPLDTADVREWVGRLIDKGSCRVVESAAAVPERLFAAADALVLPASGPIAPLPVALSMASGRPIVAAATPQLCELLQDRSTALLVANPSPRSMARRVLDLFEDQAQGARLQDRARAEAYDLLTMTKCVAAYRKLYERLAAAGESHSTCSPTFANPSEA